MPNPFAQFDKQSISPAQDNLFAQFGPADDVQDTNGVSRFAAPQLPQPEAPNQYVDAAKSLGSGLARGAMNVAGLPGAVETLGRLGINAASNYAGGGDLVSRDAALPTGQDIEKAVSTVTGPLYRPQTTLGKYAGSIGEFAPGLLVPGGAAGLAGRALTNVVAPAVASEALGQATEGTDAEPYARVAGAVVGGMAPSALARLVSPLRTAPEKAAHIATLRRENIPLTAGDAGDSKALKWTETVAADMPFAGGPIMAQKAAQQEAFTRAALNRAGIQADRATADVMNTAFDEIGDRFSRLARNSRIDVGSVRQSTLDGIVRRYNNSTSEVSRVPMVQAMAEDIANITSQGAVSGERYAKYRSDLSRAIRGTTDHATRQAFGDLQRALDIAIERGLPRNMRGQWRQARTDYRNMLVIEDAASRAGERVADGLISPANLASAAKRQGKRAYTRGQSTYDDLARAGVSVLSDLPQSGTAPRMLAQHLPFMLAGAAAGAAQGGDIQSAGLGALLGPALFHRGVLMTRPVQRYLSNRVAANIAPASSMQQGALATLPFTANELAD